MERERGRGQTRSPRPSEISRRALEDSTRSEKLSDGALSVLVLAVK